MPYADKDKQLENARRWRKKKMAEGYGKALYARRAARYKNEEILRAAVEDAITLLSGLRNLGPPGAIEDTIENLKQALDEAPPIKSPIEYMEKES